MVSFEDTYSISSCDQVLGNESAEVNKGKIFNARGVDYIFQTNSSLPRRGSLEDGNIFSHIDDNLFTINAVLCTKGLKATDADERIAKTKAGQDYPSALAFYAHPEALPSLNALEEEAKKKLGCEESSNTDGHYLVEDSRRWTVEEVDEAVDYALTDERFTHLADIVETMRPAI